MHKLLLFIIFVISILAIILSIATLTYKYEKFQSSIPSFMLPKITLNEKKQFIEEASQRLCQFHGVNIVVKGDPWIPYPFNLINQQNFEDLFESEQTRYSLVKKDFELLQQHGVNCIRLGVMMPGVYPDSGSSTVMPSINEDYLNGIQKIIEKAGNYNIYVILDLHQDILSSIFCGEGLPIWFAKKIIRKSTQSNYKRS